MLNEMFAIVFYLTHGQIIQNPPSILWAKKHLFSFSYYPIPIIIISYDLREQFLILCDKKAIILVCNVWVNLYVGLCNIDFIKLMTIILV